MHTSNFTPAALVLASILLAGGAYSASWWSVERQAGYLDIGLRGADLCFETTTNRSVCKFVPHARMREEARGRGIAYSGLWGQVGNFTFYGAMATSVLMLALAFLLGQGDSRSTFTAKIALVACSLLAVLGVLFLVNGPMLTGSRTEDLGFSSLLFFIGACAGGYVARIVGAPEDMPESDTRLTPDLARRHAMDAPGYRPTPGVVAAAPRNMTSVPFLQKGKESLTISVGSSIEPEVVIRTPVASTSVTTDDAGFQEDAFDESETLAFGGTTKVPKAPFCPQCGAPTRWNDAEQSFQCSECGCSIDPREL